MSKARVLSCIQPTGDVHLGNYLGAIKNWAGIQDDYDCIYGVVDYHAITADFDPSQLRKQSVNLAMDLIACGIDPERSILFIQSHVPEHTELCWVLFSSTAYGDLTRMTQFKTKAEETEFVNAGLFNYPVLQAADILIYKPIYVPVGEDQRQHVELCREIARKFNATYGETFIEPGVLTTRGANIRSLADPEKKMSKSYGEKHSVGLFEDPESIHAKLKRAVTDTGPSEQGDFMSPGVDNLFTIIEAIDADKAAELMADYRAKSLQYSTLKEAAYEGIMAELAPIREKKKELLASPAKVEAILADGAERARTIARATMQEVREKIGVGAPAKRG